MPLLFLRFLRWSRLRDLNSAADLVVKLGGILTFAAATSFLWPEPHLSAQAFVDPRLMLDIDAFSQKFTKGPSATLPPELSDVVLKFAPVGETDFSDYLTPGDARVPLPISVDQPPPIQISDPACTLQENTFEKIYGDGACRWGFVPQYALDIADAVDASNLQTTVDAFEAEQFYELTVILNNDSGVPVTKICVVAPPGFELVDSADGKPCPETEAASQSPSALSEPSPTVGASTSVGLAAPTTTHYLTKIDAGVNKVLKFRLRKGEPRPAWLVSATALRDLSDKVNVDWDHERIVSDDVLRALTFLLAAVFVGSLAATAGHGLLHRQPRDLTKPDAG